MPHPIWNHAATCVVRILNFHDSILTNEQENSVWSYISGLPVRTVVDLLNVLDELDHTVASVVFGDVRIDDSILNLRLATADHYLAILNHLRVLLGQPHWFPSSSPMCENANQYFQHMRDVEAEVGFNTYTQNTLYTTLTEYGYAEDETPEPNHDDDAIIPESNHDDTPETNNADDDASTIYSENISTLL